MRKPVGNTFIAVIALAALLAGVAAAQEATGEKAVKPSKPLNLYRVDFAIHESEDGKRVNTRSYTLLTEEGGECSVRTGNRMPIQVLVKGEPTVQYMDVGVRLDCQLYEERDGHVGLRVLFEINGFAQDEGAQSKNPLLRNISSEVRTAVVPGKPTVVSAVDDSTSKRRYELEVTATKVK